MTKTQDVSSFLNWRRFRNASKRGKTWIAKGLLVAALPLLALPGCGPRFDDVANLGNGRETIVCFGDSLTRGHGASPGRDYPAVLSAHLGQPVINAGRDGDTTATALNRLEEDVLAHAPRLVIVKLGGNDFLRRQSQEQTARNLEEIVSRCVQSGAMVMVVHAKFGLFRDPYRDDFQAIAEQHGAVFVGNTLRGILGRPARMSDQIHPNDAGYALLAERIANVAGPLLEEAGAVRAAAAN